MTNTRPFKYLTPILLALIALSNGAVSATESTDTPNPTFISVTLSSNIEKDSRHFLAGRPASEINNYSSSYARRDVISFILMQQALYIGGYRGEIEVHKENTYLRNLNYISDGEITLIGEPIWLNDTTGRESSLYISDAIIREGEFVAGLYTRANHPLLKHPPTRESIKNYSAVSNRIWKKDWALLEALEVKHIQHSLFWRNIIKMVHAGRADFTLAPFQKTADFSINAHSVSLRVIPGVKVVIPGSRHFVVSRKHVLGATTFSQLQQGLKALRAQGTITRAYTEAGVFNKEIQGWTQLNQIPHSPPEKPSRNAKTTTSNHQEFGNPHTDHPLQLPQP